MITRPESAAFPYLDGEEALSIAEVGLTKRELFAALALQGMLANPNMNWAVHNLASDAVGAADLSIEELNLGVRSRE